MKTRPRGHLAHGGLVCAAGLYTESSMSNQNQVIDITPTWSGVMPILLAGYENGSEVGRKAAESELYRLAKMMDEIAASMATPYKTGAVKSKEATTFSDSKPVCCPYCGSDEIIEFDQWETTSLMEKEHTCKQTEYQCKPCEGRTFWC